MTGSSFVDYYDVLQISPNAEEDTIQQMFRHLAKKWHPDSRGGNPERFRLLVEAHKTLTNPERRVSYDLKYQRFWETKWNLQADASGSGSYVDDREAREGLLSLYYVQRRSSMNDPGLGELEVARLMRIPIHLIEFHIWYLKEKGWIQRLENGKFALTAPGVDEVEKGRLRLSSDRLIAAHTSTAKEGGWEADRKPPESIPAHSECYY